MFVHVFLASPLRLPLRQGMDGEKFLFSGGQMPSHDLLFAFQSQLQVEESWQINGAHYERTANAWLDNLDCHRAAVVRLVGRRGYWRWRTFLLACAELWGYGGGEEWQVSHYTLRPYVQSSRGELDGDARANRGHTPHVAVYAATLAAEKGSAQKKIRPSRLLGTRGDTQPPNRQEGRAAN